MRFRGGRRLAGHLDEDAHEAGAVVHGDFVGQAPRRFLQEGGRKLEGADRDVALAVVRGDAANDPGVAVDAVIAHQAARRQRRQGKIILRRALLRFRVVAAHQFLEDAGAAAQGVSPGQNMLIYEHCCIFMVPWCPL